MEREHPLAGMFQPMSPEALDRAVERARVAYKATTPAEWRHIRREGRMGAVRAWIRWILHV